MIHKVASVPLLALLACPASADEPKKSDRTATELLTAGVKEAKEKDKAVFLLFGSPG